MPPDVSIAVPDAAPVAAEFGPLVTRALALKVATVEDHGEGLEIIKRLRGTERQVEELFAEPKHLAFAAHKSITAAEAKLLKPLWDARRVLSAECFGFEEKQRLAAEEESRRLQEIARKDAEDRALADAIAAESEGNQAEVEAILAEPVAAPVIHVAPAVAKVEGVSSRMLYSAECHDKLSLVRWVAANPQFLNLLLPNQTGLNDLARAQREAFAIPGVRLVKTQSRSVRMA